MAEKWHDLGGGYFVSDLGRVFAEARDVPFCDINGKWHVRKKAARYLKPNISPAGYCRVNIYRKVLHVHTLVARAFCGDPPAPDSTVNHIDLDKTNNRASNLEWLSNSENVLHAWAAGAHAKALCPVLCIDTGETFESIHAAARRESMSVGNLCSHLKGRQKSFAGKQWRYVQAPPWPKKEDADA